MKSQEMKQLEQKPDFKPGPLSSDVIMSYSGVLYPWRQELKQYPDKSICYNKLFRSPNPERQELFEGLTEEVSKGTLRNPKIMKFEAGLLSS